MVGEILPGVMADNPFGPVSEGTQNSSQKSRGFFLNTPGGTGKTIVMHTIQSLLQFRGRKVIFVTTSAVAVSPRENGRTAHSVFKIPIPCDAKAFAAYH